jgi:hypothetical protein
MSATGHNPGDDLRDQELNRAVREALQADGVEKAVMDPNLVLAYLHGEATDEQANRLRKLLARSPALRRELLEIASDLDQLDSPAIAADFAAESEPAAPDLTAFGLEGSDHQATSWQSTPARGRSWGETVSTFLRETFAPLFWRPAFAYTVAGLVFVLMAYPTYRYFTTPEAGDAPHRGGVEMVLQGQRLHLRPDLRLRSEIQVPATTVQLADCGFVLDLTLWASAPLRADQRFQVQVMDARGTLWQDDDYHFPVHEAPDHYRLLLNRASLSAGELKIQVSRFDATTDSLLATDTYSLLLE